MGVSACGKSTIAEHLAQIQGLPFLDADDFPPKSNVDKMASGQALNDEDRTPWLEILNGEMQKLSQGKGGVLACSALKIKYRLTIEKNLKIQWIYLKGSFELLKARIESREDHFMPVSLLTSQLETLEEPPLAENCWVVEIDNTIESINNTIKELVSNKGIS